MPKGKYSIRATQALCEEVLKNRQETKKAQDGNWPVNISQRMQADNGMKCTCEGMHPNPECPCHRLIR